MSLRINTNLASINAQRSLSNTGQVKSEAMRALASGSRITQAADDAAGLSISENLRATDRSNRMAKRNAEDAISFIQVGEGGLNEVNNILVRMRELATQSASDTIGDTEREFIGQEVDQLMQEIDRIAESTNFGDKNLLNGTLEAMEFQVGTDGSENSIIRFDSSPDATASSLGVSSLDMDDKYSARDAMEVIDEALTQVGSMRSNFGALQNRLDSTIANLDVSHESMSAANSRIRDADIAAETAKLTSAQVLEQASIGMLAQANQSTAQALKLVG
ncbi:MAG: flagellin FliC [Bdellovibrionales bacterium]|nr:flagellin FliC [Bdellovibrionales bacterium]